MVIYEVNLTIDNEIYDEYYAWLVEHIQHMLKFTGFDKAELGIVEPEQKSNEIKLRISYTIDSYENLQNYLLTHAAQMRHEGIKKFGNKFNATRRIIIEPTIFE